MNPIYEEFRDLAIEMLEEFGTDAVLLKPGAKTGPEHRPEIGPPTRHDIRVFQTSKKITSVTDPRISIVKNSFLISTVGDVQIEDDDSIETPDGILSVKNVREIAPVFLTILWIAEVGA